MEKLNEYYKKHKKIFIAGAGILGAATLGALGMKIYYAGFYDGVSFLSASVCNLYYSTGGTAEDVLTLLEKEMSEGTICCHYPPKSFKPFMMFRK